MSLITFEGWENYTNFSGIQTILNYSSVGQIGLITITDANNIAPRNSGACLKYFNESNSAIYPKILIQHPFNLNHTSGTFGFAWHSYLPPAGSIPRFTPLAGVVDPSGISHFYVGINASNQIEVCRWNSTSYNWNTNNDAGYYPLFDATNYTSLGATTQTILANDWNFIEVSYTLASGSTGSINVRMNTSAFGSNALTLTNVQTTAQSNVNARSLVFGRHFGDGAASNGGTHSKEYITYIDDIYWCDASGTTYNSFLGRISSNKINFDTVAFYDFTEPQNKNTALQNVSDDLDSGLSTTAQTNLSGTTFNLKAVNVSGSLNPTLVRQVAFGYRASNGADLSLGIDNLPNLNTAITTGVSGALVFRDYDNYSDGSEWGNQKITNTIFKYTTVNL
jgi:hypothetical protein